LAQSADKVGGESVVCGAVRRSYVIAIYRKAAVARVDEFVGPKS
jgi:hypothetical protein